MRLRALLRRREAERELDAELRYHLERQIEQNVAGGMGREEARRAALKEFGGLPQAKEYCRDARGVRVVEDLWHDVRYGARLMLRSRGPALVAVVALALGIGANTAIFSVVNSLLLRPLPYRRPEQLVKAYQSAPDPSKGMLPSVWSYPRFEILRGESRSFAAVAGHTQNPYNLTGTDEPERLQVEMVSAGYFPLLGVEAAAGRTFTAEEDGAGAANPAALLSHGLWQRRFGGDERVLGQTVELDKRAFTVVGVLPPGFRGQTGTADAWVTMAAAPLLRYPKILTNANNAWFQVVARLRDGVTAEEARAEMAAVSQRIERQHPGPKQAMQAGARVVTLAPLRAAKLDPAVRNSFLILLAAVGLVLLIACANVANLLLARGVARRREFAVRAALGAGRGRIIRQLLAESLMLSLLAGALGLLVALWGVELIKQFRPSDDAQFWSAYTRAFDFFPIDLDGRVLAFNFLLALLTGLLFGLLPALQSSRADLGRALKDGAASTPTGFHRLRRLNSRGLLVVSEIALSLVLLAGAGLMLKSLSRLHAVDLGFDPANVLTMAAPSRDAKPEFYEQLLARVAALPGVEAAGLGSTAPLLGHASMTSLGIEGRAEGNEAGVGLHSVSPDYFKTLGIPVLRGRAFTERDRPGAPRVALVNQTAAAQLFPGEDPVGKRIKPSMTPEYETDEKSVEIVGVVGDARYGRLEGAVEPDVYLPAWQPTDAAQTLVLRTSAEPAGVVSAVRREVRALDRNVPVASVRTMDARVAEVTSRARFITFLLGIFAGLALLLAAVGIYGVVAYSVSARAREVGIRIALGAQRADVLRLVLLDGLPLVAAGLALGLLAAWAAARVLRSQLYEVSASDPLIFAGVTALLAGVALLASLVPARKATKVDPANVLRAE
ncbi:MAG TPA: ABC transporter permease [Pyrinomonadaceae bacterium]